MLIRKRNQLVQIPFYRLNEKTKDYHAYEHDICYKYNNVYLFLQTYHEMNNVIVFTTKYTPPRLLINIILQWIRLLYTKHGIEYISIYKEHRGWSIINKFFVLKEDDKQYYGNIPENMETLDALLESNTK